MSNSHLTGTNRANKSSFHRRKQMQIRYSVSSQDTPNMKTTQWCYSLRLPGKTGWNDWSITHLKLIQVLLVMGGILPKFKSPSHFLPSFFLVSTILALGILEVMSLAHPFNIHGSIFCPKILDKISWEAETKRTQRNQNVGTPMPVYPTSFCEAFDFTSCKHLLWMGPWPTRSSG